MNKIASLVFCLLFFAAAFGEDATSSLEDPVTTSSMGTFRGSWMTTRRSRRFQAYRGIRYAKAPIGELRFQPPQAITNYTSEVNATVDGPICPQANTIGRKINEDCLMINVYTPNNTASGLLPVIVFIHPGAFYFMSGTSEEFGPEYMLENDVVLVTFNYRLGTLGFLATGDKLAPGNNGFKDQVVALKWIQVNIAAFGGNPDLVTLTGSSAGSVSTVLHIVSPMSKGLFHRAVSMSGSPISKGPLATDLMSVAVKQAELVGCPINSSQAIIDCLKTLDAQTIADTISGFAEFGTDPLIIWFAVVEPDLGQDRFLPEQPLNVIRDGNINSVPYIVSQTKDEFFWDAFTVLNNASLTSTMDSDWNNVAPISFYLPNNTSEKALSELKRFYFEGKTLANDSFTAHRLGRLYGDGIIGFSAHRLANLMCRNSPQPVYYYEFDYMGNYSFYLDPNTNKPVGVSHCDDLLYLFTRTLTFPVIELNTEDSTIIDKMTGIFYNFARYGDPNPQTDTPELIGMNWPVMTASERKYEQISTNFTTKTKLFESWFQIWEKLYPIQYSCSTSYAEYEFSYLFENSTLSIDGDVCVNGIKNTKCK